MRRFLALLLLLPSLALAQTGPAKSAAPGSIFSTREMSTLGAMFTTNGWFGAPGSNGNPFTCNASTIRSLYYDTGTNTYNFCNGSVWGSLSSVSLSGNNAFTGTNTFLDGANFKILGTADNTKVFEVNMGGNSTGITSVLAFADTAGSTHTFQAGTDTLAHLAANTFTAGQIYPAGTCTAPTVGFTGATTTGIVGTASPSLLLCSNGALAVTIASNQIATFAAQVLIQNHLTNNGSGFTVIGSGDQFGWASATTVTTASAPDTIWTRGGAAATFQLGAADAAAPVAQTFQVQSVVGGTSNVAGTLWLLNASRQTGSALAGEIGFQEGAQGGASGTTQASYILREDIGHFKALSNNTVTTIANLTAASNTVASATYHYGVEVFDATNLQYEGGFLTCGVINKAGVFSNNVCVKSGSNNQPGSGTLTVTFTITGANPALIQINANSSLTPSAGYPRVTFTLQNDTNQQMATQ